MIEKFVIFGAIALSAAAAAATAVPSSASARFDAQRSVYRDVSYPDAEQCFLRANCIYTQTAGWICPNPKIYALCDIG